MWFLSLPLCVSLLLAVVHLPGVRAFQPRDKAELVTAVNAWIGGDTTTNGDINAWDTSLIADMSYLFHSKTTFNSDISGWNVSSVTNMRDMFQSASAFNQDISAWDVSSVTNMQSVFFDAYAFNQDISAWDVSSVTNMQWMFYSASAFNQNISAWDVSSVTNMHVMFGYASAFNQVMCWDLSISSPHTNIHTGPRFSIYIGSNCVCTSGVLYSGPGTRARHL
jgi:surface protein